MRFGFGKGGRTFLCSIAACTYVRVRVRAKIIIDVTSSEAGCERRDGCANVNRQKYTKKKDECSIHIQCISMGIGYREPHRADTGVRPIPAVPATLRKTKWHCTYVKISCGLSFLSFPCSALLSIPHSGVYRTFNSPSLETPFTFVAVFLPLPDKVRVVVWCRVCHYG